MEAVEDYSITEYRGTVANLGFFHFSATVSLVGGSITIHQ